MAVEHAIANGLLRPLMQNFTPGVVARLVRAALLGAKNDSTFACTESVVQLLADACCHSTDLRARVGLPQAELLLDSALYLLTSEETTMAMADSLEVSRGIDCSVASTLTYGRTGATGCAPLNVHVSGGQGFSSPIVCPQCLGTCDQARAA